MCNIRGKGYKNVKKWSMEISTMRYLILLSILAITCNSLPNGGPPPPPAPKLPAKSNNNSTAAKSSPDVRQTLRSSSGKHEFELGTKLGQGNNGAAYNATKRPAVPANPAAVPRSNSFSAGQQQARPSLNKSPSTNSNGQQNVVVKKVNNPAAAAHENKVVEHVGLSAGRTADPSYVTMKKIEGKPASELVSAAKKNGNTQRVNDVKQGVAQAVDKLHSQGVAHQDVHLGNFIVGKNNKVTPIDYGKAVMQKDNPQAFNKKANFDKTQLKVM